MSDRGLWTARFLLRAAIGVVIVVEVVLALGVLLQALAANPDAGFSEWAYRNQDRVMTPFEDIFEDRAIGDSDAVVDISGLFALAVYGSLFVPLGLAVGWVSRVQRRREEDKKEAAETAQRARMFGGEPEPEAEPEPRPTLGQRLRALVDRRRGPPS